MFYTMFEAFLLF